MSESHWRNLFHKEVKSWDSTTWFKIWQFQTPAWKRYLQMHLLAERFAFWGDDRGFLKVGIKTYPIAQMSPFTLPTFFVCLHIYILCFYLCFDVFFLVGESKRWCMAQGWDQEKETAELPPGGRLLLQFPVTSECGSKCHCSLHFEGGARNLPRKLPPQYYEGFVGCLKSVRVNGKPLEMLRHMNTIENVSFCVTWVVESHLSQVWQYSLDRVFQIFECLRAEEHLPGT